MAGSQKHHCECSNPGCSVHPERDCGFIGRTKTLYRVDMEDKTGTRFCPECAEDAIVFDDGPN